MRLAAGGASLPARGALPSLRSRSAGPASPQHMGAVLPGESSGSSILPKLPWGAAGQARRRRDHPAGGGPL
eukprot:15449643-Alexandrium_andersonii.AAC.1